MLADRPILRRRRPGLPLSDSAAFAEPIRRTTVLRWLLALAVAATAALAVWHATRLDPNRVSFLPSGSSTVVVLDESRSVYLAGYRRVQALLRRLVDADASIGLVIFSDTAYELLPPGTHARELRPLLRFYSSDPRDAGPVDAVSGTAITPWGETISGGTRISAGLQLARQSLTRDRGGHGVILLVSDLETAEDDRSEMASELTKIRGDRRLQLRVVPLFPIPADQRYFEHVAGRGVFVDPARFATGARAETRAGVTGGSPRGLVALAAVLLLLLAANELACGRVELPAWRSAR